jgi:hypothetical protein
MYCLRKVACSILFGLMVVAGANAETAIAGAGSTECAKFVKFRRENPQVSTVTTHNSAMNRVFDLAVERGWIAQSQVPKLKNNGKKGTAREAFSHSDYKSLVGYMPHWIDKGHTEKTNQMRRLLRDYVLVLANTGNDKDKVPVLRDTDKVASHRLVVENKVLGKKRAIYFYTLDTVGEHSRPQACINQSAKSSVAFSAPVNKLWLEKVNALFVSGWLREYGERITWAKHKLMRLELDSKKLVISHYGERGNFSNTSLPIDFPSGGVGKSIKVNVLSKDILPLLSGLADTDIKGKVGLSVTEDVIAFAYQTELAAYNVFVPTCAVNGKRNKAVFEAYGG